MNAQQLVTVTQSCARCLHSSPFVGLHTCAVAEWMGQTAIVSAGQQEPHDPDQRDDAQSAGAAGGDGGDSPRYPFSKQYPSARPLLPFFISKSWLAPAF